MGASTPRRRYSGTWRWRKADLITHILAPHPGDPANLPTEKVLKRSTIDTLHGWHCKQHGMPGFLIHEIVAHGYDVSHEAKG